MYPEVFRGGAALWQEAPKKDQEAPKQDTAAHTGPKLK